MLINFDDFLDMQSRLQSGNAEFGCVMIYLEPKGWKSVLATIDKDDLTDKGLEDEPHVTGLYGLHSWSIADADVVAAVHAACPAPIAVETAKEFSLFEVPEKYDVLKIDCFGPALSALNAALRSKFPRTNTYDEYHPHMTVAYLKPGAGKKYAGKKYDGGTIESASVVYSMPKDRSGNRKQIKFSLDK